MSVGKFGDTWTTADKRVDRTAPPAERGRTAPVGLSVQQELSRTPALLNGCAAVLFRASASTTPSSWPTEPPSCSATVN